ncbi:MAG: TRAP transporter substrate-binding protein [Aestuariivita sp.]|nr:TRAP transporter substrate-binding protein [Aestuariivita sp.]MCY4201379.1 TRAP transporter substrate-binding protein [Aestuariivita sp.]
MKKYQNILSLATATIFAIASLSVSASADDLPETEINYVGTWGNLSLFKKVENPFWSQRLTEASGGAITVNVQPFTEMGLKGSEILRLLRNGVFEVSATLLSYVGGEIPEAEAVDLAGITRDIDQAHAVSDAYKPVLEEVFEEQYGVKLLAIIPYHAQIVYCRQPISSIEDFAGRKVRASGRSQGDMIEALGGTAVGMAFGEVVPALEKGVVDCAITGALSGNLAKWHQASSHLYPLPISWAITFVAANKDFWDGLAPPVQEFLVTELAVWEDQAWESGRSETNDGVSCNTGGNCVDGNVASMTLIPVQDSDYEKIRQIMNEVVVPRWAARCGPECAVAWNETVGGVLDLTAPTN